MKIYNDTDLISYASMRVADSAIDRAMLVIALCRWITREGIKFPFLTQDFEEHEKITKEQTL